MKQSAGSASFICRNHDGHWGDLTAVGPIAADGDLRRIKLLTSVHCTDVFSDYFWSKTNDRHCFHLSDLLNSHQLTDATQPGFATCGCLVGTIGVHPGLGENDREVGSNMLEWKDVTGSFSESSRHWKGRYLEICEVAENKIECSLFSCEDDDWEIYFSYGKMHGVSYASADKAADKRKQIMEDFEREFEKNGDYPSGEFMDYFDRKYGVDIFHAFF